MALAQQILDKLGYRNSPNFLRPGRKNTFEDAADFGHVFRRARKHCHLHGVYSLRQAAANGRDTIVPVVYVCEADSEAGAERIHKLVWNQNVVPFLIVTSQKFIRLYSGFRYESPRTSTDASVAGEIRATKDMGTALQFLDAFRSVRIDDGTVWERWGNEVTPETRVDWKLLSSLNDLDSWLRNNGIDDPHVSHSLIGKYVYLQYLRHRDILSDRKLEKWGLEKKQIFGRTAQVSAFWKVVEELDNWLNGSVFPLKSSGSGRPKQEHIRKVAGTFAGDDPVSGQLSLDFDAYDFSFIPIETLSVIYEQFLHAPVDNGGSSLGRKRGAYYTPLSVVKFMLEELDELHRFKDGMRVLDPACGSGAFLVQCYRRIIEQDDEFKPAKSMRPARLRELLEQHIFGIDRDEDACRVAKLSLSLTLLDYVDPPDLERTPRFRLPELHGANIFHGDFFDPAADWREGLPVNSFDWIVGNPPWVELKREGISDNDRMVWGWMQDAANQQERPVGGNQVAEAFAWEVIEHLDENGCIALLLPAMTLFKDESRRFRKQFLTTHHVHAVANFANLAEVLFPGHRYREGRRTPMSRPRRPAAAFFYSKKAPEERGYIDVFSPFVADQPAGRPTIPGRRKETWNIVVNASQIRAVEVHAARHGEALPWKTAMWGSHLDIRLLDSVAAKFLSLEAFCESQGLELAEGFQLRKASSSDPAVPMPELVGRNELKTANLRNCGLIFEFPDYAVAPIQGERANLRLRGGKAGLAASYPPHIVIDKGRRFAVYSDEFVAVPPRQIGIAGNQSKAILLKALSLYLVSDFAIYHQFLMSPEWGVSTSISTLDALRALPIPLAELSGTQLKDWSNLHSRLIRAERKKTDGKPILFVNERSTSDKLGDLLMKLNSRVYDLLQLTNDERHLVSDLVRIRMQMVKGKVAPEIVRSASEEELRGYGEVLLGELDAFIDDQPEYSHFVTIVQNGKSAIVGVTLESGGSRRQNGVVIEKDESALPNDFAEIQRRVHDSNSQWIYFRRNLRLYEGRNTYIFKPIERLHWTKSQALLDAGSIIAETLS